MHSAETPCTSPASVACLIETGGRLRRSLHAIEKGIEGSSRTGLNFSQWAVLQILSSEAQIPIGEIGQRLGLAGCTATRLIDQLEEMRMVARQRLTADRRVIGVSLTEAGRSTSAATGAAVETFWSQQTSGISEDEIAVFLGVLDRFQINSDDLPTRNFRQS